MKNLREIRKIRKLTQKDVAAEIRVPQTTYSRYERGFSKIDPDSLIALAKFFDVSTDYLLGLIEVPLTSEEVSFMKRIYKENDPTVIANEFDVYIGDQKITGEKLLEIMSKMKKLDKELHGDFFKTDNDK